MSRGRIEEGREQEENGKKAPPGGARLAGGECISRVQGIQGLVAVMAHLFYGDNGEGGWEFVHRVGKTLKGEGTLMSVGRARVARPLGEMVPTEGWGPQGG